MPADEFHGWIEFYRLFPFDDHHRYHRPASLLYAAHPRIEKKQEAVEAALKWLSPDPAMVEVSDADARTLAAFGLKLPGQR